MPPLESQQNVRIAWLFPEISLIRMRQNKNITLPAFHLRSWDAAFFCLLWNVNLPFLITCLCYFMDQTQAFFCSVNHNKHSDTHVLPALSPESLLIPANNAVALRALVTALVSAACTLLPNRSHTGLPRAPAWQVWALFTHTDPKLGRSFTGTRHRLAVWLTPCQPLQSSS